MAEQAGVAVAVVSWNTRELLDKCLRSLAVQATAGRIEVWVVDNGSTDGSRELVKTSHPWANLLEPPTNLGFGSAVNLAAQRTSTRWIAPANADIELTPHAIEILLRAGEQHPEAGAIAPQLVSSDGGPQHSVYPFPTLTVAALLNLGVTTLAPRIGDRLMLEGCWNAARARPVDWAIGAFLLVRRAAWDEVGGFDETQWMYAEDLDLGWRLARAGWATRYEPAARVYHHGAASTAQRWGDERDTRWLASTYRWMLCRRGEPITRAYALVNIAGAGVRVLLGALGARVAPGRLGKKRSYFRRWARLHLIGLASRSRIMEHG